MRSKHNTLLSNSSKDLERFTKRYANSQSSIPVDFRKLVPEIVSPDRTTHFIHPYPAKLLVQIPVFFLSNNILSNDDSVILDPFCGSGTVMLESMLSNRKAYGADANPLARLISEVKTTPLCHNKLLSRLEEILARNSKLKSIEKPDVVNLEKWFYPEVVDQLQNLLLSINDTTEGAIKKFFQLCFSKCVSKVSLADPRVNVPVILKPQKYSHASPFRKKMENHLKKLKGVVVRDVFEKVCRENINRMKNLNSELNAPHESNLISDDAKDLFKKYGKKRIKENSVDLIITSPPYPGAQKYIRSCTFGLGWLDLSSSANMKTLKQNTIGREEYKSIDCQSIPTIGIDIVDRAILRVAARNKIRAAVVGFYLYEMLQALNEMKNSLKCGGHLALIASNNQVAGHNFPTAKYLRLICEHIGFKTKFVLVDQISSRGLMTKRNKTAGVITREYVLLCEK